MARLSLTSIFKHSKAIAEVVNDLYDEIRDHTVSFLSVAAVEPKSVRTKHLSKAASYLLSNTRANLFASATSTPLEVTWAPSGTDYQAVVIGVQWQRRTDGVGPAGLGSGGTVYIDFHDGTSYDGSYIAAATGLNYGFGRGHGRDKSVTPQAGVTKALKFGGGPAHITTRVFKSPSLGGVLPVTTTKFGLFPTDFAIQAVNEARQVIWAFIEDNG